MQEESEYIDNAMWPSFKGGQEDGFTYFFKKYYGSLCFFANRFVRDKEFAEDIVSDSLEKVWEKREKLDNPAGLKNYCYTVVYHSCLHWIKNQQRKGISVSLEKVTYSEETILSNIIRAEVVEELHTAIQRLPPKNREVFSKLYIEGKSVAETAKELNLTISTIKSHKKNGLALLRKMVSPKAFVILMVVLEKS